MAERKKGKRNQIFRLFAVLLLLFVFEGSEMQVHAAEQPERLAEAGEDTFFQKEWGQDVSLQGTFGSTSLYVTTGKWAVTEAVLHLKFRASQLLDKEISCLSVSVDGILVDTFQIPSEEEGVLEYSVLLPAHTFSTAGGHSVSVATYLRGQTADACIDENSTAVWVSILEESSIQIRYQPEETAKGIAGFLEKFLSVEALSGGQSGVMTGEGAGESALTAIARILSGFAESAQGEYEKIQIKTVRMETELMSVPFVLYVDSFDRLPDFLRREMSDTQKEQAEKGAVICLIKKENNRILLVTGTDEKAIEKAGMLLSNHELTAALKKDVQIIDASQDYQTEQYQWEEYLPLTEYGATLTGNFEQSVSFSMDCPVNKRLAESAQLSLDYRYSSNLDFEKSLLTVYINDVPIGSRTLTLEGADGTTEVFSIPQDINAVGSFQVEVRFNLCPKGDWCNTLPEELPWAYVAESSMLKWTTMENTEVFFEFYPFPFIKNGEFSETLILMPVQWKQEDFKVMGGLLLTMGKWLKGNRGELTVSYEPQEAQLADKNVISIGNSKVNYRKSDLLETIAGRGYGLLEISPYSDKLHALLTITGATESGMMNILNILGEEAQVWRAHGDLIVTDGEQVQCSYFRIPEQREAPPEIDTVEVKEENVPFVMICSVLILSLLAAALMLLKYRK